jgi:hypothetical protein
VTDLRLDAVDDEVFDLTMRAVRTIEGTVPRVSLRCRSGGCVLGAIGATDHGPLLTSSWEVETTPPFKINANGTDLGRAQSIKRWRATGTVTVSGTPDTYTDRHGTIALLTLPPELPQEFPDLLVRCKHGDAVVGRSEALAWYQSKKLVKIEVSMPLETYAPLRPSSQHTARKKSRETHTFGDAGGRSPEDVKALLRRMGHDLQ